MAEHQPNQNQSLINKLFSMDNIEKLCGIMVDPNVARDDKLTIACCFATYSDHFKATVIQEGLEALHTQIKAAGEDTLSIEQVIEAFQFFRGKTGDIQFLINVCRNDPEEFIRECADTLLTPHENGPHSKQIKEAQAWKDHMNNLQFWTSFPVVASPDNAIKIVAETN